MNSNQINSNRSIRILRQIMQICQNFVLSNGVRKINLTFAFDLWSNSAYNVRNAIKRQLWKRSRQCYSVYNLSFLNRDERQEKHVKRKQSKTKNFRADFESRECCMWHIRTHCHWYRAVEHFKWQFWKNQNFLLTLWFPILFMYMLIRSYVSYVYKIPSTQANEKHSWWVCVHLTCPLFIDIYVKYSAMYRVHNCAT